MGENKTESGKTLSESKTHLSGKDAKAVKTVDISLNEASAKDLNDRALAYHKYPKPGKIALQSTKPCETASDLSLAYSPGVAAPCLEIADNDEEVYNYTSKGNLVGVISNGTAVLGLGNIGPHASKPVMEGKGVLFKTFADIDVFDLELDCKETDHFISTVKALAPTFGGINLEDIKAPECFHIEKKLIEELDIPVFHDDQHGTAIIAAAALQNALEIVKKDLKDIKLVVSGAGASALASCQLLGLMGLPKENLILCDSKGVVYTGRKEGMNEFKEAYAVETEARTLSEALENADVFIGLSAAGILKPEMLKEMSRDPIVFAMSNPDPEIDYDLAVATRSDVIMATGRSDFPNQVNNVLGFPFIFRGALDVRASKINDEMKLAAVAGLARLAKEPVPKNVTRAYGNTEFSFGRDYLIPKPFDPRVLYYVSPAVAKAAIETGVARKKIDIEEYTRKLRGKENSGREILQHFHSVARKSQSKRVVYAEGAEESVIRAARLARSESIAEPILVGNPEEIKSVASKIEINLDGIEIVDPSNDDRLAGYIDEYATLQTESLDEAQIKEICSQDNIFSCMMLRKGDVDGMICGVGRFFPKMVRPIFKLIGLKNEVKTASGLYVVSVKERLFFFADTALNTEMDSKKLASIAISAADFAKSMDIEPRIAMLSYSNFGSVEHSSVETVRQAADLVKKWDPKLEIDGEMAADTAVVEEILQDNYPFSNLKNPANVLVFPDMQSGNISYKLLQKLGNARVIGPIILGLERPAYVMPKHTDADEIFNMTTVAVAQAKLS